MNADSEEGPDIRCPKDNVMRAMKVVCREAELCYRNDTAYEVLGSMRGAYFMGFDETNNFADAKAVAACLEGCQHKPFAQARFDRIWPISDSPIYYFLLWKCLLSDVEG